jgi:hypothetical protein
VEKEQEDCDLRPPSQPDTPYPDYDEDPWKGIPKNHIEMRSWPVVTEGEFAVKDHEPEKEANFDYWEPPAEEDPYPHYEKKTFKDSIKKFFGGLPASGQMPDTVYAADALPGSLVALLQMPPETKLTMLGPHNTNDIRSYHIAMSLPDDLNTVFGISYVTPDGQYTRQYVRLKGDKPTQ